jgi:hypothetical protein
MGSSLLNDCFDLFANDGTPINAEGHDNLYYADCNKLNRLAIVDGPMFNDELNKLHVNSTVATLDGLFESGSTTNIV